jgi:SAM-dependent methyltransferase
VSAPRFTNVYDDAERAAAYAALDVPGTYFLAYRDLPQIIAGHVAGRRALDFGCGTGRSTRFLARVGFRATGIDIARSMIDQARALDPDGDYRLVPDDDLSTLAGETFDLVLCVFPFDNIPGVPRRESLLHQLASLLGEGGRIVLLGSRPEIYVNEWASFTTRRFPENRRAASGDPVRVIMTDVPDARPVVDFLWRREDYLALYAAADLGLVAHHEPLGQPDEPYPWVSETTIAPWFIDVLGRRTVPEVR